MTRGRRLSFLAVAAVIVILAVVVLGSGKAETGARSAGTPTPSGTRVPSKASPRATATPAPVLSSANETALTVNQGDTVRFRVRSDSDEVVHVHGYDLKKAVGAGATVAIAFKADITGIFEIEFEKSGTLLAQLKVLP